MDAKGPGAITRWWIPLEDGLKNTTLRIYLDGNPEPVISENYHSFLNGSSYVKWPFAFVASDEKDVIHQYNLYWISNQKYIEKHWRQALAKRKRTIVHLAFRDVQSYAYYYSGYPI
jgi:hypothetical protein